MKNFFIATFALAISLNLYAQTAGPDLILHNGKIITLDNKSTVAQAIAITGNRITAVGSSKRIKKLARKNTSVVNLDGHTLIPGLIDGHTHTIRRGIRYPTELDWAGVSSLSEALEKMREFADGLPEDAWVVVGGGFHGGWHPAQFIENRMPTPQELHEAAGGRPAYARPAENIALITPHGLKILGIKSDANLPRGGTLELDADGKPTGIMRSNNGWSFIPVAGKIPRLATTHAERVEGLKEYIRELNEFGMTGVVDAGGMFLPPNDYKPLFELWQNDELTIRMAFHLMSQKRGAELEDLQSMVQLMPQGFGDGMLKFNGFGEVLNWPMSDGPMTLLTFAPPKEGKTAFLKAARWMAQGGYTAKIHASSDAAARIILSLIEEVNLETPIKDLRWSIEHLNNPTEETLSRIKDLGMIHSLQSLTYFSGYEILLNLGEERAARIPPMRMILDSGVIAAAGTDTPEVPKNPWPAIRWLMDGMYIGGTQIHGDDQVVTREEALRLFTIQPTYLSFDEDERGSIEVGKLADIAVLDRDYMKVDLEEVADIKSLLTIVDGRIVHATGDFEKVAISK